MTEHPPRDDTETTTHRRCPICGVAFTPVGRQAYHSNACRQVAYRRRNAAAPPPVPPPTGGRRANTIYTCPECDTRYHGQQWCHDCNQPCTRLDRGGLCPHCDEPVTLSELLNTTPLDQPARRA